jgi:TatD DNase family protein
MIDTHCHLDLYPDPSTVAREAIAAGVGTIAVTNLPSAFERAYPFVGNVRGIKLALGLHPLVARDHPAELGRFAELAGKTCYIGEVGLDFSPAGYATREQQVASFRFVLDTLRTKPVFMTVHSRRAEAAVLELLHEYEQSPAVFHWYSGPLRVLREALAAGHYVSLNPAMIASPHGQKVIAQLPPERVLTETDGPFVRVDQRLVVPADVALVEAFLAEQWKVTRAAVTGQIKGNFTGLRQQLGGLDRGTC